MARKLLSLLSFLTIFPLLATAQSKTPEENLFGSLANINFSNIIVVTPNDRAYTFSESGIVQLDEIGTTEVVEFVKEQRTNDGPKGLQDLFFYFKDAFIQNGEFLIIDVQEALLFPEISGSIIRIMTQLGESLSSGDILPTETPFSKLFSQFKNVEHKITNVDLVPAFDSKLLPPLPITFPRFKRSSATAAPTGGAETLEGSSYEDGDAMRDPNVYILKLLHDFLVEHENVVFPHLEPKYSLADLGERLSAQLKKDGKKFLNDLEFAIFNPFLYFDEVFKEMGTVVDFNCHAASNSTSCVEAYAAKFQDYLTNFLNKFPVYQAPVV